MTRRRGGSEARAERGAVLVVVGLAMVVILIVAATVVDLGAARWNRRTQQASADLAATAAGYFLSGHGTDGSVRSPRLACEAALASLDTNVRDASLTMTAVQRATACTPMPVDVALCNASTDPIVVSVERPPHRLTVAYPVLDAEITDDRLTGLSERDGLSCDRLAVTVHRRTPTSFAAVIGVDEVQTEARAVVAANGSARRTLVAALLLLERTGCAVLSTSGGGSEGGGVVVESASATNPGIIQVDSAGTTCSSSGTEAQHVVYGTALPSASGGGPSIVAGESEGGMPGVLGLRSLAPSVNGRGAAVVGTGVVPAPIAADVISRQPADDKYNPVMRPGIATLHGTGRAAVTSPAPPSAAVISGSQCSGLTSASFPASATASTVYVDCDDFSPHNLVLPMARTLIARGKISIGTGRLLSLPNAGRVYVRGCVSGCSGGGNYAISVSGELRVNTVATGTSGPVACADRAPFSPSGNRTEFRNAAVIATFGGPMLVSGLGRLCQTMVYLASSTGPYVRATTTSGGGVAACSLVLPCPTPDGGAAHVHVGGSVDWSAPNAIRGVPGATDMTESPFEDLALWAETSSPSQLKGQGANRTEGVYFLPNSAVEFYGQGAQEVPLNAQFFARTLRIRGQGTLRLRPNPADAVLTPLPGALTLIR